MTAQRPVGATSGPLTVKVSYVGTPGATVFYQSHDLNGGVITNRTSDGITESVSIPGLFFYDQVVSLDQFVAEWDEADGVTAAREVVATRHPVKPPGAPSSVVAVGGNASATVSFVPGDTGGNATQDFTVTALDTTTSGNGGQTQSGPTSPIIVSGLTNGDHYTFTVVATNGTGSSPASSPSNQVTPAPVVAVPGAPTGITATVTGSGQVTVTFTPPVNNGGAAITAYLVTAIDETNSAHNTTHAGNSPNVVTSLVNGEVYHFTVHATNSAGNSAESIASNSVTPSGTGGVATFTYTQPSSSTVLLDATGSTGTLAWEVDSVAAVATTTTLLVGPLSVGSHHIKLTATSGGAGITERDIDVAWVGQPLDGAQHDGTNGLSTGIVGNIGDTLDQWDSLPTIGPWRNKQVLNQAEDYPTKGDGAPRIVKVSDNHITLMTRANTDGSGTPPNYTGDWLGSGGYRSSMEMNTSYDGTLAGNEFGKAAIDTAGNLAGTAVTGSVRFYRVELMIPGLPTNKMHTGGGTPYSNGTILYQNNACEIHGNAGGSSPVRFQTNGAGTQLQWAFEAIKGATSGGQQNFDTANIQWDSWYLYVVEFLLSKTPTVGYIRIYRDFGLGAGMAVLPMALCPAGTKGKTDGTLITSPEYGKYYPPAPWATQQLDKTGVVVPMAFDLQNYRTRASLQTHPNYPDLTIHYRNVNIGPTLASVMI